MRAGRIISSMPAPDPSQGGKARAKSLSPAERQASARKAAQARWQGTHARTHEDNMTPTADRSLAPDTEFDDDCDCHMGRL